MRTRNRGRPTSFVSSLGLCGRKSSHRVNKVAVHKLVKSDSDLIRSADTKTLNAVLPTDNLITNLVTKCAGNFSSRRVKRVSTPRSTTAHRLTADKNDSDSPTKYTISFNTITNPSTPETKIQNSDVEDANMRPKSKRIANVRTTKPDIANDLKSSVSSNVRQRCKSFKVATESDSGHNTSACSTPIKNDNSSNGKFSTISNEPMQRKPKRSRPACDHFERNLSFGITSNASMGSGKCVPSESDGTDLKPLCDLTQTDHELQLLADMKIGAADNVLGEILQEINDKGRVPRNVQPPSQDGLIEIDGKDKEEPEPEELQFDNPLVGNLYHVIWSAPKSVLSLEMKDLFLAVNGIFRPGVCELWRRRREYQNRQLNRSSMGRLRPNPRPRRYSDMIIAPNPKRTNHGHQRVDEILKLRRSSRSMALAVARLSAAKRIMQARTRRSVIKSGPMKTIHHSRSRIVKKVGSSTSSQPPFACPRRSSRAQPQLFLRSRSRRKPDISHHIDWKFCYSTTEKDRPATLPQSDEPVPRRRRKVIVPISDVESEKNVAEPTTPVDSAPPTPQSEVNPETVNTICEQEHSVHDQNVIPAPDSKLPVVEVKPDILDVKRENRNRRKRALTVQRKRPVDKLALRLAPESWAANSISPYRHDDESSTSSTSVSGLTDAYGRPVRSILWTSEKSTKRSRGQASSDDQGTKPPKDLKPARTSHRYRSRHVLRPFTAPRRSRTSIHIAPPLTPRQRITRRPDSTCQLTFLDRLVLGLNCSVSQCDDKIHIKQLHADEMSILTQRINKTGFVIQSLALRTNVHGDSEYNLVLTFSPTLDITSRRNRGTASHHRLKLGSASARKSSSHWSSTVREPHRYNSGSDYVRRAKFKRAPMKPIQTISRHSAPISFRSSAFVSTSLRPSRASKLRATCSDDEGSGSCAKPRTIVDGYLISAGILLPGPLGMPRETRSTEMSQVHPTKHNLFWMQHLSENKNKPNERREELLGRQSSAIKSASDHISQDAEHLRSSSLTSQSDARALVNSATKRPGRPGLLSSYKPPPYRKHSPRKVIRKVYTGTLTVPTILTHKRSTNNPSSQLTGATSVAMPTTCSSGVISSAFNPIISFASSNLTSTGTSTTVVPCLNGPTAPAMMYDESMNQIPPYPQSMPTHFPMPYRQYPSNLAPVTMMSPALHTNPIQQDSVCEKLTVTLDSTISASPKPYLFDSSINTAPSLNATASVTNSLSIIQEPAHSTLQVHSHPIALNTVAPLYSPRITPTIQSSTTSISENIPKISTSVTETSISFNSASAQEPVNELAPTPQSPVDAELSEVEDSHTPATSMSASQLLKLKRLHDEPGHSSTNAFDPNIGHPSQTSSRVQSPSVSAPSSTPSASQTQPIHTDPTVGGVIQQQPQYSQLQTSVESRSSHITATSNPTRFGTSHLSNSAAMNRPVQYDSTDPSLYVHGEGGDFELRSSGRMFEPLHYQAYRTRSDRPRFPISIPSSNVLRGSRPMWSPMRSPFPINSVQPYTLPVAPTGLTVVRTLAATKQATTQHEHQLPTPVATRVVHKYHTFRKILPKSPEHPGSILPPLTTPTYIDLSAFESSTPGLTQLPVINHMFRSASHPSSLSSDAQHDQTTLLMDYNTSSEFPNKPIDRSSSLGYAVSSNPASQLLKSLLESGDASSTAVSGAISVSATTANSNSCVVTPSQTITQQHPTTSASTTWNQPAHQSRGTWQLSKRTGTGSTNRSTTTSTTHRQSVTCTNSEDRQDAKPFSVSRLIPGSISRLQQQLQRRYQKE